MIPSDAEFSFAKHNFGSGQIHLRFPGCAFTSSTVVTVALGTPLTCRVSHLVRGKLNGPLTSALIQELYVGWMDGWMEYWVIVCARYSHTAASWPFLRKIHFPFVKSLVSQKHRGGGIYCYGHLKVTLAGEPLGLWLTILVCKTEVNAEHTVAAAGAETDTKPDLKFEISR